MHTCNWPGCTVTLPRHIWGCKPHWFALPSIFRHDISRAWSGGISDAWIEANDKAVAWIKEQQAKNGAVA